MASARGMFLAGFASAVLLGAGAGALAYSLAGPETPAPAASRAHITPPDTEYGPQKVVYHVATRGSWRDRASEAWRLVAVLNNHLNAIEPADLSVRVIFQGDGIETLKRAKTDARLAAALDGLKKRGVAFRVCANTLEAHRMGLETLYGVGESDLVQAGVAELIHLQKQGYAYIRF